MPQLSSKLTRDEFLILFLMIGICLWLAYFSHFREFGLYGDDYSRNIGMIQDQPFSKYIFELVYDVSRFFQGHPLGFFLVRTLAYVSVPIFGLHSMYVFLFIIELFIGLVFYKLLRLYFSSAHSLIGALLLVLFPADTTKITLVNGMTQQLSLLLILLAAYFYLTNRLVKSYVLLSCSLITYATPFPIFAPVPLLGRIWNLKTWRLFFQNLIYMTILFVSTLILRSIAGESRLEKITEPSMFLKSIKHMLYGPQKAFKSFFVLPESSTATLVFTDYLNLALIFILLLLAFFFVTVFLKKKPAVILHVNSIFKLQQLLAAICILSLGYALILTTSVFGASNINARVHLVGGIGCALIWVFLISQVHQYFKQKSIRIISFVCISLLLVVLVGQGMRVQDDYVRQWAEQKSFWRAVLEICPDLESGTSILVESDHKSNTGRFVNSLPWSSAFVLQQLYKIPENWRIPRLYDSRPDWRSTAIQLSNNSYQIVSSYWPGLFTVRDGNIIVLTHKDGVLTRQYGSIIISNQTVLLKPNGNRTIDSFEKGYLYSYMFGS